MSEREIKPAGKAAEHGAPDASEQTQSAPQSRDPRAAKWQAIVKTATAYNAAHPDLVAEFNKLTGGKCTGENAGVSVRALRVWQSDHGLPADGKIGPKTIAAAKSEGGAKDKGKEKDGGAAGGEKADVEFSDEEAGTVEGEAGGAGGAPDPAGDLADDATTTGETAGEEKAEPAGDKNEGDTIAADAIEKTGEDMGSKAGGKAAGMLALVPRIVSLLEKHDFKGALKVVWESVGQEDRAELLKLIAEKIRGKLAEKAVLFFEKAAIAGLAVDVLELGWEWTKLGLDSIREAHEKGDQKARIRIYAFAWSDTVLRGEHDNPGAVTPEEREALKLGVEDGLATRAAQPELPFLLLAQYHGEGAARQALELSLMKKAGI